MKKPGSTRAVALILAVLVLLPALFYSGYEINALSSSERMVADVYRRQLDVALYSINQYAWDVVNNWASAMTILWNEADPASKDPAGILAHFFEKHAALDGVFLADSTGAGLRWFASRGAAGGEAGVLTSLLKQEPERVERLVRFSRQDYRKLESLTPGDSGAEKKDVLLLFVFQDRRGTPLLAGMRIDETRFVNEVLSARLREAAAEEFTLAVIRQSTGEPLFATDAVPPAELKQRRQLWLFPDLAVGIRLRGATIEEVARSRFMRNVELILGLDLVLIAGVFFVYRSIRREMAFVRMKSDFVSNVSHELRTPLALIRMYAETLEMGRARGEEKRREYYSTILKEAERLTRLVNNLLNFSRMEAGRKPYTLVDADLNDIVAAVMETFGPHLRNEGFSPSVVLSPSAPRVRADAEAVQEALINLLDNAVKYGGTEKFLKVATGSANGVAFISVEDHGIGIAHEYHGKVFETFYRVSDGLIHTAKGSGLGLSIAKHIMDAHAGRIDLSSAPGKGSTFRLVFPAWGPHHSATEG